MGLKNQSGQALIEFAIMGAFFATTLVAIEYMIQQKNIQSQKYKLSTEVKNEIRYKNKNQIDQIIQRQ
jgi:Flp pilus assembly pilin Flp